MKTSLSSTIAALLALTSAGCLVGPNYHPPLLDMPKQWSEAQQSKGQSPPYPIAWWESFKDPELDS